MYLLIVILEYYLWIGSFRSVGFTASNVDFPLSTLDYPPEFEVL
jgi:hypothetical protein